MSMLKEQFEMVLSKYFHKDVYDNGWDYKNDCVVAFCHEDHVVCYFKLDEEFVIRGHFDTNAQNEIRVFTPEDLEVEIQKFLMNEKELIKKRRLKQIKEL